MPRRKRALRNKNLVHAIRERDGDRCHLCGRVIDFDRGKENPNDIRRPTLDHVVPESFGGKKVIENLRLAHAICNHRRGNKHKDSHQKWWLERLARRQGLTKV